MSDGDDALVGKGAQFRARLASPQSQLGGWISIPSPLIVETLASTGVDYLCIDCQHGFLGVDSLAVMLQVAALLPIPTFVRPPGHDTDMIGWVLDSGADGIIVPGVEDPDSARRIADACRYPQAGRRSRGGGRASMVGGPTKDEENAAVLCFVMIETVAGLEAVEKIAAVDGVDGIYVGPNDLAISLGVDPTPSQTLVDERHLAAVTRVREAAQVAGRFAGIHAVDSAATVRARIAAGFEMCTAFTEIGLLRGGATQRLSESLR